MTRKLILEYCAEKYYQILASHEMINNGGYQECRFRLTKQGEGTGYIRTEVSDSGGWQNSHSHKYLKETYIVQQGIIACATLEKSKSVILIYTKGDIFTVERRMIHNIYLFPKAIIHTVKHGDSYDGDKVDDKKFDRITRSLSEEQVTAFGQDPKKISPMNPNDGYTETYRHFDNLIWQLPVWSTAIFTLALMAIDSTSSLDINLGHMEIEKDPIIAIIFAFVGIFLCIISYALHRFRWHQARTNKYIPKNPFISPQTFLQLLVLLQGLSFISAFLMIIGFGIYIALIPFLIGLVIFAYQEIKLRSLTLHLTESKES